MKLPSAYESISIIDAIDMIDKSVEFKMEEECLGEALAAILVKFDADEMEGYVETVNSLVGLGSHSYQPKKLDIDLANKKNPPANQSILEPPKPELNQIPSHLRYEFLGSDNTLPVIVSALLNVEHMKRLLEILIEYRRAIGWTIADIQAIPSGICEHKIQLEEDSTPSVEHQWRLNPPMQEAVKKEIIKWLDVGVVYPVADCKWVSPVQCVPKKGGITVVPNAKNELILTRTITGWRVCMDYRKLNSVTCKDHLPMPFIDQILDRLAGRSHYCFLDSYSGYNQININLEDQEKTTFTFSYGTFAFSSMSFGLLKVARIIVQCNRPLGPVLKRCEKTNLVLKWKKYHFMDFSKIANPMCKLLEKEDKFDFDEKCRKAFDKLKERLTYAPIIVSPDWSLPFELMCDASVFVVGARLLAIVVAFEKFRAYLLGSKVVVYTDHATLRSLETSEELDIDDAFPDERVLAVSSEVAPWYEDIANLLVTGLIPDEITTYQKTFLRDSHQYYWDHPYLFRTCTNNIIRCCVLESEVMDILKACHDFSIGGHLSGNRTATKVLECGYYWPTLYHDTNLMVKSCDQYQCQGVISKRHEMPMNFVMEVELFDVWGIDFMGPFMSSGGMKYILVVVDCVSKWVKAVVVPNNEGKSFIQFLKKNIFTRFGTLRALISDGDTHFCNKAFAVLVKIQLEHKSLWALKKLSMDWEEATKMRLFQMNEMDEFRYHAYESTTLYKEKKKYYHDVKILKRDFQKGDFVLLYNSKLKLFPGKLKSRWSRPFEVVNVSPNG
ncbi:uncharacterized protein LOC132610807 [Lycium barbarum]|uniref:uncharacterized protein LOC132610807 n=1 Tax=Lycium barbarum TaxID=112863 RepID=UPI00293E29E7|nr:uncharacterized protein LOC132610807 [Lycium barbarum]